MQTETTSPQSPNPRPRLVTLLSLGVLIIAGWHLLRLVLTIQQWAFLASYSELSPSYLAISGLIWFVAGSLVAWGLWCSKRWAARAALIFNPGFVLYFWADRLFVRHIPILENWLIPAVLALVWLAFSAFVIRRTLAKTTPANS